MRILPCRVCGAQILALYGSTAVHAACLTDGTADANDLAPDVTHTKGASRKWGATPGDSSLDDSQQAGNEQIGDPQANDENPGVPISK